MGGLIRLNQALDGLDWGEGEEEDEEDEEHAGLRVWVCFMLLGLTVTFFTFQFKHAEEKVQWDSDWSVSDKPSCVN